MKYYLLIMAIFAIGGCSSQEKKAKVQNQENEPGTFEAGYPKYLQQKSGDTLIKK